jgi:hypothetical protein
MIDSLKSTRIPSRWIFYPNIDMKLCIAVGHAPAFCRDASSGVGRTCFDALERGPAIRRPRGVFG